MPIPHDRPRDYPFPQPAAPDVSQRSAERRQRRVQARKRRNARFAMGVASGIVLMLVVTGVALGWNAVARARSGATDAPLPVRGAAHRSASSVSAVRPVASATPYFASHGKVLLRLPVSLSDLTEVGFHQASYSYAVKLSTKLPDADSSEAKKNGGTGRDKTSQAAGDDAWLIGSVLRMWRSRPGKPNTAADVGAKAGSQVLAPVDGTVLLVKHYKLYDKYPDYEIHIRPDADPSLDLVMIHITDPVLKAGDRVIAGISPVGKVRKLSDRIKHQLGRYTGEAGDHTHLQLNDATDPKYKGLKDAPAL